MEVTNRNKKTTVILLIIAVTFCVQWLPYHIYIIALEALKMMRVQVDAKVNSKRHWLDASDLKI